MAAITFTEGTDNIDYSQIIKEDKDNIDILKLSVPESTTININDTITYKQIDTTTLFKGIVQSFEFGNGRKTVVVQDLGSVLLTRNINTVYNSMSPEAIIQDVLTNYAPELTYISTVSSGLTIPTYVAKNKKAWDVVTEMAELLLSSFSTDASGNFNLELEGENLSNFTLDASDGSSILKGSWKQDISQLVNAVTVEGEDRQSFEATPELFSGTGAQTEFVLSEIPIDVKVEYPVGTPVVGYVRGSGSGDYYVDRENKKIVFDSAPASAASNIKVYYNYSIPIAVRRRDFASITTYGQKDKVFRKPYIKTRNDASQYANYVLNRYKTPLLSSTWIIKDQAQLVAFNDWLPNESISVVDSDNGIGTFLVIRKVVRSFPGTTEITVGTPEEDIIFWQKEAQTRIKQLEEKDDNSDLLNEDEYVVNNVKITILTEVTQITKIEKGAAWILDDVVNSEIDSTFKLDGATEVDLL